MADYRRKDHFYRRAKKEGYLSRAAYKLKEINRVTGVIRAGDFVIDVGCAPGGWSQVALEVVGEDGRVLGLDLLDCRNISRSNYIFMELDVTEMGAAGKVLDELGRKADVVISDAAPNTTGIKFTDHARSVELVTSILGFSSQVLKKRGNLLVKVFEGPDSGSLLKSMKQRFDKVKMEHPRSSRKGSIETYIVARGFRPSG